MSLRVLLLRNLRKNIRNYYLYVFALTFSVALYFSFVTLRYDPALTEIEGSIKGAAAIGASSVLLVTIVAIFVLYANAIFVKRRGREIGLLQLIGLTRGKIFRLLTAENAILYGGSLLSGIGIGFLVSRLILMVLFKLIGVETAAKLQFYPEALVQAVAVFAAVYVLVMGMNALFIRRQTIISLFQVNSVAQERVRKLPMWEWAAGIAGLVLILTGYALSARLFSGDLTEVVSLMTAMIVILVLVIAGTYIGYKGSVSVICNAIRKRKNGYLSIRAVLSLSSLMFRMKSNALLLTVITTVSALAIGLLSLSYITYYSTSSSARLYAPHDFGFTLEADKARFIQMLNEVQVGYVEATVPFVQISTDISGVVDRQGFPDQGVVTVAIVSDADAVGINVRPGEAALTGFGAMEEQEMVKDPNGELVLQTMPESVRLRMGQIVRTAPLPRQLGQAIAVAVAGAGEGLLWCSAC